ncbi:PTS glucitol/sorbitol transporter subunit IIC [Candidatus Enterococcus mangumiae]|uniref:PTS system, glucitol/sorbitol-specific IIC component n=1 Tax=Candidatus Enterococcus mangumiae TaxID=2230878 RepID=A0ABZ2SWM8_9ENTE|nr:PTS glucitol/sorbitol transporter subunit IIC [Enterococcus sp. DIV1094]MBO0489720.1 PTS glucitol/sorbitol transporter subunit IIC [Enterococcus sp. DIV1094]
MDFLVSIAENFIGVFDAGGENFMGLITGILPTLIVLLTFVNALIALVGEERVSAFAQFCTKNIILRYSVFPLLAVFFLTNPMCYSFGRFLKEKQKPAFYDSAVSLVHPITGLFPHANAGELFVWTGIASGLTTLGLSVMPLAVRYFLVGMVVITIRGIVTELLTKIMWKETDE